MQVRVLPGSLRNYLGVQHSRKSTEIPERVRGPRFSNSNERGGMTFQEMQEIWTAKIQKLEREEMQAQGKPDVLESIQKRKRTVLSALNLQRHWFETGRFDLSDVVPGSDGE